MKNKYQEYLRNSAKRQAKTHRKPLKEGVHFEFIYPEGIKHAWWTDFGFYLGSQYIQVLWVHPRMQYQDICEDLAWVLFDREFPGRVISVGTDYSRFWELHKEVVDNSDVLILPSIKVEQWSYGRGVFITYPVELLSERAVIDFAKKLKAHMQGKTDMFAELGDYEYDRNNWANEGHTRPGIIANPCVI